MDVPIGMHLNLRTLIFVPRHLNVDRTIRLVLVFGVPQNFRLRILRQTSATDPDAASFPQLDK